MGFLGFCSILLWVRRSSSGCHRFRVWLVEFASLCRYELGAIRWCDRPARRSWFKPISSLVAVRTQKHRLELQLRMAMPWRCHGDASSLKGHGMAVDIPLRAVESGP